MKRDIIKIAESVTGKSLGECDLTYSEACLLKKIAEHGNLIDALYTSFKYGFALGRESRQDGNQCSIQ